MQESNFKQLLMAVSILAVATVGYLGFIREPDGNTNYATTRSADFLGITHGHEDTADELDNADDLSVDGTLPGETNADGSEAASEDQEPAVVDETKPAEINTAGDKAASVYTVKEGDTYGCIAEKYYGSYEHWTDIVTTNPSELGFSEYGLFVDAKLSLPAIDAASLKPASTLCQ